ncbi:MAG: hypothetical protein HY360_00370 [Verrucomicrobia bacterium]|nr:hypothetical protein [Verrucomicrobiota bacterium]
MKIHIALFAALMPCLVLADDINSINLLPNKDQELQLPYAQSQKFEFVCPWDASKRPTVLEFTARIDTPSKIVFTCHKTMVGEQTLAEYCRANGMGEATVVFGEITVRPRKDSDEFQRRSKP